MGFKIDSREGGSGVMFYVLIAIMIYALASGVVAWQTLEDCGHDHTWEDWRVIPPGWECKRAY